MLSDRDKQRPNQTPNPHSNRNTQDIYSDSHRKIQEAFGLLQRIAPPPQEIAREILIDKNELQDTVEQTIAVHEVAERTVEMTAKEKMADEPSLPVMQAPLLANEERAEEVIESITTEKKDTQLNKLLGEFFKVQREFHSNMGRLFETISKHPPSSYQEKLHLLEETIKPFKILANNPFMSEPTGNNVDDMMHIMQVMDQQNHEFHLALRALADSISRTQFTSAMLKDLQRDEQAFAKLKEELGCKSMMVIQSYFDQPMQNLCRYMLLLTTIKQEMQKSQDYETKRMLSAFIEKMESFSPLIKNINENLDSIEMLTSVEHVLKEMLDLHFIKSEHERQIAEIEKHKSATGVTPFSDDVTLSNLIKFTIDCAYTGKVRIVRNEQDYYLLFTNLLAQMKEIDSKCEALLAAKAGTLSRSYSYVSGVASATYYLFFAADSTVKTPQEELKLLIKDFSETIDRIEAVRALQEKARSRATSGLVQ